MYVVPKLGLKIRDPDLMDLLPDEGREVPESDYWVRRVNDGDVTVEKPPAAEVVAQPAAETVAQPAAEITATPKGAKKNDSV
jgi:hypothetical protein